MRVQLVATEWVSITMLLMRSTVIQCLRRGFTVCSSNSCWECILTRHYRFALLYVPLWYTWFRNLHTFSWWLLLHSYSSHSSIRFPSPMCKIHHPNHVLSCQCLNIQHVIYSPGILWDNSWWGRSILLPTNQDHRNVIYLWMSPHYRRLHTVNGEDTEKSQMLISLDSL